MRSQKYCHKYINYLNTWGVPHQCPCLVFFPFMRKYDKPGSFFDKQYDMDSLLYLQSMFLDSWSEEYTMVSGENRCPPAWISGNRFHNYEELWIHNSHHHSELRRYVASRLWKWTWTHGRTNTQQKGKTKWSPIFPFQFLILNWRRDWQAFSILWIQTCQSSVRNFHCRKLPEDYTEVVGPVVRADIGQKYMKHL